MQMFDVGCVVIYDLWIDGVVVSLFNEEYVMYLFQIMCEVVSNGFCYGGVMYIMICFYESVGEFCFFVQDNGCGFLFEIVSGGGYGLVNIWVCVERVGGKL